MLNIFKFLKENNLFNTCVILDDYKFRDYYHIVREYFEIKTVGRLGICSIKDTKINTDFKKLLRIIQMIQGNYKWTLARVECSLDMRGRSVT